MKLSLDLFRSALHRRWKNMYAVCGLRNCPNTMLMRSVPQSRVGIRVGERWYCSVDCFAEAALTRLSALSGARSIEAPHSPRLPIGLLMLSKGYLTDEQLRLAGQSQMHGEELEAALLRLGFANDKQVAAARAAQWGCPVLGQERIGQPVETDIPATLFRSFSAVPLHHSMPAKRLLLGFVHRVEHSLLLALEQVTGCRAEPCFITPAGFGAQMACLTAVPDCGEVILEESMTPKQMAKTVGGYAVEVAAREARFAHCRDYIWTRLSGNRRSVDVLFRVKKLA